MDKVQFYKNLILGKIEELREDLGELRYQIYRDSVLRCEDYSQLREMADLELQMDMAKYVRDLKRRLAKQGMKIEDLREEIELPELIEEDVYEDEEEELLEPEIVGDAARVYQEEISKLVGSVGSGILFDYDDEEDEEDEEEEDDLEIEDDEDDLEIEEDSELEIEEDEDDGELEIIDEEEWEDGEEEDDLAFINVKKTVETVEEEDEEEEEEDEEEEDLSWLNKTVAQSAVDEELDESDFEFEDIEDIEEGGGFESASDLDFLPEKRIEESRVGNFRGDDINELSRQNGFTPFNEGWGMDKPKIEKRKEVQVKKETTVKKAPFDNGTDRGKKTQGMFDALNKVANSLSGVAEKTKKSSMFKLDLDEDDNDEDIIKF